MMRLYGQDCSAGVSNVISYPAEGDIVTFNRIIISCWLMVLNLTAKYVTSYCMSTLLEM